MGKNIGKNISQNLSSKFNIYIYIVKSFLMILKQSARIESKKAIQKIAEANWWFIWK